MMTVQQYLRAVRQYRALAQRMTRDFSEQVDHLTAMFIDSETLRTGEGGMNLDEINALAAREYPDEYRSFPQLPRRN